MDNEFLMEASLVEVVDKEWAKDSLPTDDIAVSAIELPDPDPDDLNTENSLKAVEKKWADIGINRITIQ
jgi:hypothetical protein